MSDQAQGPGWWRASDGKWYPSAPPPSAPPPLPPRSLPPQAKPKRWPLVLTALFVVGLVVKLLQAVGLVGDDPVPIRRQSCAQLVETYNGIELVIGSQTATFEERSQAAQDASAANRRIAELDGCPGYPSLR